MSYGKTRTDARGLKRAPRFDVEGAARALVTAVLARQPNPCLVRDADGAIHVVVARAIPRGAGDYKQTIEDRRRRLGLAVRIAMLERGWRDLGGNRYAPAEAAQ